MKIPDWIDDSEWHGRWFLAIIIMLMVAELWDRYKNDYPLVDFQRRKRR